MNEVLMFFDRELTLVVSDVLRLITIISSATLLLWLVKRMYTYYSPVYPLLAAYLIAIPYAAAENMGLQPKGVLPLVRLALVYLTWRYLEKTSHNIDEVE